MSVSNVASNHNNSNIDRISSNNGDFKFNTNFMSVDPTFVDIQLLQSVFDVLCCRDKCIARWTTPYEVGDWENNTLDSFTVDIRNVDRLYYLHSGMYFHYAVVRVVDRDSAPLYVLLDIVVDYDGLSFINHKCSHSGYIFVSRDVNMFMRLVLSGYISGYKSVIYSFMKLVDGLDVDEEDAAYCFDSSPAHKKIFQKNHLPSLQYLCCEQLYLNKDIFYCQESNLSAIVPPNVFNSVKDFMKIRDAEIAYISFQGSFHLNSWMIGNDFLSFTR